MGVFLDKPKKEQELSAGEGNGLRYAVGSMQGWRTEMEDAHTIKIALNPDIENSSYFAVFDGHAGDFVSKYSSENLLPTIIKIWLASGDQARKTSEAKKEETSESNDKVSSTIDLNNIERFQECVTEGFLQLDRDMITLPQFASGEERSGTTAVGVFIFENHHLFVNCGDSRALISRNQKALFSTKDHKPANEEETKRIEKAGGYVTIARVNGSLAVSRALGDYDYKKNKTMDQSEQLVSPVPDLTPIERSSKDEFILIACDGVWDVMTNEDIVNFIHGRMLVYDDLKKICEDLLETCLAKGSRDNMSAIIIALNGAPKVQEDIVAKERELEEKLKVEVKVIVDRDGEQTSLTNIIDEVTTMHGEKFDYLPPGGGLHVKVGFIESYLDELLPDRNKNEDRSGELPALSTIVQQIADRTQQGGKPAEPP